MDGTARKAATATLVALSIIVAALALWKLKVVIALLFLGFVIASAMRPSVEWLHRRARIPRSVGVVIHYLGFLAAIGLFLYLVVPAALTQVDHALAAPPCGRSLARGPPRDPERARQAAPAASVGHQPAPPRGHRHQDAV